MLSAMKDITDRNDIIKLVDLFYKNLNQNEELSFFFRDVNWEKHLVTMYDFWENVIFYNGEYSGNPMVRHKLLHSSKKLTKEHFQQWNKLFFDTVDQCFKGENAELIKLRANNISNIMRASLLGQ